jgi:putative phosphoesterase
MLLGLISDTHDNLSAVKKAVNYFNIKNVDIVLHAGDLIAHFVSDELKRLNSKVVIVFGIRKAYIYVSSQDFRKKIVAISLCCIGAD